MEASFTSRLGQAKNLKWPQFGGQTGMQAMCIPVVRDSFSDNVQLF